MSKKFSGFSLAELLIALAIVGIVAALTIPNVYSNYQKKSYLSLLEKTYRELDQNLKMIQAQDYYNNGFYKSILALRGKSVEETAGCFFLGGCEDILTHKESKPFYNVSKDCEKTAQPCFAASYKNINGDKNENFTCSDGYNVTVQNGTALCIIPADNNKPATVYTDVNGAEGPNIGGRDMFKFYIFNDYTIDDGSDGDYITPDKVKDGTAEDARNTLFSSSCLSSTVGEGCFGKILNDNWEMNY